MADEKVWDCTDHGGDSAWLQRFAESCIKPTPCVASISTDGVTHLTREALADLVRAAAPLAGLTVVDGEPEPEPTTRDLLERALAEKLDQAAARAAAAAAIWTNRRGDEQPSWLWNRTIELAHYITTGESA